MAAKSKVRNLPRNTKNRALISELWDRVSTLESQVKTLNEQAIKDGDQVEIENGEVKTEPYTIQALAKELGVKPGNMRGWLRVKFPRPKDQKNTRWGLLPDNVVAAAKEHWSGS